MITLGKSDAGTLRLDPLRLVDTRLLVQANSGGGKSWLLRLIAEKVGGKIPTIVLDPEGEFATLREKVDFLLVGPGGEVPADPRSASLLARRLLELRVSAVIDLVEMKLHDRRRFVRAFCEALRDAPKKLWRPTLIMLDEAHKYCPERSAGDAESTEAVIDLCSLGRKRGFGAVLATQRLSKLHKDAAAELSNVCIGRTILDVDAKRATDVLGMATSAKQTLRDLVPGEFFAFGPAFDATGVVRFQAGKVATTHPKAGQRHDVATPSASKAIRAVAAELAELPQQAEEEVRDLAAAKREIAELKRRLHSKAPVVDAGAIERAVAAAEQRRDAHWNRERRAQTKFRETLQQRLARIRDLAEVNGAPEIAEPAPSARPTTGPTGGGLPKGHTVRPTSRSRSRPAARPTGGDLPKGEGVILTAVAQHGGEPVTREQLTVLTGYKRSSRDTYLQRLREKGYIEAAGGGLVATPGGVAALGPDFETLPTGAELRAYWLDRLPGGERRILEALIAAWPDAVHRESLSDETGYKRSSRDTYVQRLKARQIVDTESGGKVKATQKLFD